MKRQTTIHNTGDSYESLMNLCYMSLDCGRRNPTNDTVSNPEVPTALTSAPRCRSITKTSTEILSDPNQSIISSICIVVMATHSYWGHGVRTALNVVTSEIHITQYQTKANNRHTGLKCSSCICTNSTVDGSSEWEPHVSNIHNHSHI